MFTHDYIYNKLKSGIATVTFTKVDGSVRNMRCTLSNDYLPSEFQGKGSMITEAGNVIRVFDLDIREWRSFRVDSVTNVEYTNALNTGTLING
jgi:hypothetical protein